MTARKLWPFALLAAGSTAALVALSFRPVASRDELPNRIPRPAPYVTAEAKQFPPPYEEAWEGPHNPGRCATCHARIFDEWNGSMMSNAWRDPAGGRPSCWRPGRLRPIGDCEAPAPPDGTARRRATTRSRAERLRVALRHRHRPRHPGRAPARSWTASARAATCRPTTSTTSPCATSSTTRLPAGSTRRSIPSSTPPRTTAPASPSLPWTPSSATPSRARRGIFCAVCHSFATPGTRRSTTSPSPAPPIRP